MAEVLSQNQIDALLNSMQNPTEDQKAPAQPKMSYRKYDFYSPKKFTKDKLRIVKGIYDNYCRIVSSRLNSILRTSSEVEVLTVEEQRYYEFSNALNESDIMMLQEVKIPDKSKNPPVLIHINQILMANMIDRLLGGIGDDTDVDAAYTYTDIELALYRKIMDNFLDATKDAWSSYIRMDNGEERLEENPSLFQEISMDETIVIVMLNVKMQEAEGQVSICIPGNLLSRIFSVIDKRKHVDDAYNVVADSDKDVILSRVKESALTVRAKLGDAQVSLQEVCGLKVGDVLDLNKPKESDILLYVDQHPWFEGKLGMHNKNIAVKINKRVDEEEQEYTEVQE